MYAIEYVSRIVTGSPEELFAARAKFKEDELWMLSIAINRKLGILVDNPYKYNYLLSMTDLRKQNCRDLTPIEHLGRLIITVYAPSQILKQLRYCGREYNDLSPADKRDIYMYGMLLEAPRKHSHETFRSPSARLHCMKIFDSNQFPVTHQQVFALMCDYYLGITLLDTPHRQRVLQMIGTRPTLSLDMIPRFKYIRGQPDPDEYDDPILQLSQHTKIYNKAKIPTSRTQNVCLDEENLGVLFGSHADSVYQFITRQRRFETLVDVLSPDQLQLLANIIIYRTQSRPITRHVFDDIKDPIYFTLCHACFTPTNCVTFCNTCVRTGCVCKRCMHTHDRLRMIGALLNFERGLIACKCSPDRARSIYRVDNRIVYIPYLQAVFCACKICRTVYRRTLHNQSYNVCAVCTTPSPTPTCIYARLFQPKVKRSTITNKYDFDGTTVTLCANHKYIHSTDEKFEINHHASQHVNCFVVYGNHKNGFRPPLVPN